jgi:hypothetical protein
MRTIVETDATTVRVKQHPERRKKNIICRWIISIVLMCSIWILVAYIYKENEYNPEKPREQNSIPFKKLIYFIVSNNNGEYQGNSMRHSFTVLVSFIYLRRIHSAVNTSTDR